LEIGSSAPHEALSEGLIVIAKPNNSAIVALVMLLAGGGVVGSGCWTLVGSTSGVRHMFGMGSAVEDSGSRGLAFESHELDLGKITESTNCVFKFANLSDEQIEVIEIHTSCGCAGVKSDRNSYSPGESGVLSIIVEPRPDRPGFNRFGIRCAYRLSRSSSTKEAHLYVKFINQNSLLIPSRVSVLSSPGLASTAVFSLIDFREQHLDLLSAKCSIPGSTVTILQRPRSYDPGWSYQLAVTLGEDSNLKVGDYSGEIVLGSSDGDYRSIAIPVTVRRQYRLTVTPTILYLANDGRKSNVYDGAIYVSDAVAGQPIELESLLPSSKNLSCHVSVESPGRIVVKIRLTVPTDAKLPADLSVCIRSKLPVCEQQCVTIIPASLPR
jgi:hypothetical protein